MKRHHRTDVLEWHDRASGSHDRRRKELQTKARADETHPNKACPPHSQTDGLRGMLPKDTTSCQLSSTDFIRRWLLQTDEEANRKRSDSRTAQEKPTPVYVEPKTHVETCPGYPVPDAGPKGEQFRKKRKHHTSSDSSLLEVHVRPKLLPPTGSEFETEHAAQKDEPNHSRKRRRTESSVSEAFTTSSTSSILKQETFKKRARRKTREDRYATKKKAEKRPNDGDDKKPRKKKEKRGDRKKAAKRAGEDLMRNFSSKNIGQERLTMRPAQGLGLFKNGRASSPVQHRGIPDLAFSEMDFLQRSNKYIPSMKEDKSSSKSRVPENRKGATRQDEISTFFKSSKLPMQRTPLNRRSPSSSNQATDLRSRSHAQLDSVYSGQQDENSNSLDIAAKSSLGFDNNQHAVDIPSAFSGPSRITDDLENVQNSAGRFSGRSSTYISWSETQFSREAKPPGWREVDRTRESSTPESIRRSLEETGVFRDTGIDLAARRAGRPPRIGEKPSKHERMKDTDVPDSTEKIVSPALLKSPALAASHAGHQRPVEERNNASDTKDRKADEGVMKRERLVVEHFDAKLGWHERLESGKHNQVFTTTAREGEIPEQSRSAPIDRLELARFARVNRPSTTVPILQPLVSINGATTENPLRRHMRTGTDANQHTSPSDIAALSSPPRDDGITQDLGNQAIVQTQHQEPDQSTFLPYVHSRVPERVHEDIEIEKEVRDAPLVPQIRLSEMDHDGSATLHRTTDVFHENNLSYQGLPVGGFSASRSIPETYNHHHNARLSLHTDNEPYFIHQLPRHLTPYDPSVYRDHLREMEYEELDIITHTNASIEPADIQDRNQSIAEGYIFTPVDGYNDDDAPRRACEGYNFYAGGHLESEPRDLGSGCVDLADEYYCIEALDSELYDESQIMVGGGEQHIHMGHFSPAEQRERYEQYFLAANDQEQAFWRPYQQY